MGCGAVCGNNSSIYEPNQFSQKIVQNLIPKLKHAKQFISTHEYQQFIKQINQFPLNYRPKVSNKLIPKEQIGPGILTKWKAILYCLETSNPYFNNCLEHKFKKIPQEITNKQQIQNHEASNEFQKDYVMEHDSIIYQHKEFSQIEKDINRTCDLPDYKKKIFERVLKRITNHFPSMGYTQGINFIIGYLLMIGFEQFDVFWMFIHIAISRRYLLLGLFEDHFPLSSIYKNVFKNLLQRTNTQLYEHLYEQLQMDESVWVSKWFFTYFIYSFPHQMIKYVFDFVIEIGGLGLIKFAVAITEELAQVLMKQHEVCDISMFFQSLRNIEVFNEYISINRVIEKAYRLEIKKEDFNGIDTIPTNFYSQFILANLQQQYSTPSQPTLVKTEDQSQQNITKKKETPLQNNDKNSVPNQLLNAWYKKLSNEREEFILKNTPKQNQFRDNEKKQPNSIQNQLHLLIHESQQEQVKSPQKDSSINQNKNSIKDSISMQKESVPSTGCSFDKKGSRKNRDDVSEIDELWQEEERNSSISKNLSNQVSQQSRTQNGFNLKIRKTSYEDELDKFASTHVNPMAKSKANGYNHKMSSIFKEDKLNSHKPKINNFHIPSNTSKSRNLARAGQHILSNFSINEQSQHQSTNSQYSKFSQKQKKSKDNDIYGKNYYKNKSKKQISLRNQDQTHKNNNDQKSLPDHNSSSRDSYIDPQNSFYASNESIQDEIKNNQLQACSVKAFDSHRQRVTTQQDILTNSLHISNNKENRSKDAGESNVSEIQIFQAPQIFKKKNRVSSKINGAQKHVFFVDDTKPNKLSHTISEADILGKGEKSVKSIKIGLEQGSIYQESYESIFVPSQDNHKSGSYRFREQLQKCQVESVK